MLVAGRDAGIFHARVGRVGREILVLVGEAVIVADLLAGHRRAPRRRVILRKSVIGVVELGRALGDMAARQPDRGDAEPAVLAVGGVADQDLAGLRLAGPAVAAARAVRALDHGRLVPVGDRGRDIGIVQVELVMLTTGGAI